MDLPTYYVNIMFRLTARYCIQYLSYPGAVLQNGPVVTFRVSRLRFALHSAVFGDCCLPNVLLSVAPKPSHIQTTDGQENRKRETRQLAAQVVRREEEMTENHLGDNESEGDAPDDDDDLDEV